MSALRFSKILLAVLALAICSGTSYAGTPSPLVVNGGNPVAMAYVPGWAGSLTTTVTLSSGTPALNYTSAAPAGVTITAASGAVDTTPSLTVTLTQGYASGLVSVGTPTNSFTFTVTDSAGDDPTTVTVNLTYVGTPLTANGTLYKITFTKGATPVAAQGAATVTAAAALGSVSSMQLDPAFPVPSWLTVTVPATITSGGTAVTFDTTPAANIINTWAPGHYTVTVGVKSTACAVCAVNFQVDMVIQPASTNTVTIKGVSAGQQVANNPINISWTSGGSVNAYVYSSSLWPAFTATCSTATTNDKVAALTYAIVPCTLTLGSTAGANSVSGLATTSGTPITVSWDTNLLSTAPAYGAKYNDTVTLTIHIATQPGVTAPPDLQYIFTLPPPSPTISSISPGSTPALANATDQLVLTVSGTGFVCSTCIKGAALTRATMAASASRGLIDLATSNGLVPSATDCLLPSGRVISI